MRETTNMYFIDDFKRRLLLFFCCIVIFLQANAQDAEGNRMNLQGYSGGMMFHTGYLSGGCLNMPDNQGKINIEGMPAGIGGLLRLHLGKHLRIGGEGYTSTLSYGKNESFMTLAWGGLLIDSPWKINKYTAFFGGTIGGGSIKNITVLHTPPSHSIEKSAVYRNYSVMTAVPFMGMEYALTRRIHLITKVDYIVNIAQKQSDFAMGPRVYAGIIFFHTTK